MRLRVLLPTEVLIDEEVEKVIAEAPNGSFCLLPRHIDFAAALVPGILLYVDKQGRERVLGIDEGTLTKCGELVSVSTQNAVPGADLGAIRETVEREFLQLDERERIARSAVARLEAGVIRRFIELGERTS